MAYIRGVYFLVKYTGANLEMEETQAFSRFLVDPVPIQCSSSLSPAAATEVDAALQAAT
jgi:hypothetical protein